MCLHEEVIRTSEKVVTVKSEKEVFGEKNIDK